MAVPRTRSISRAARTCGSCFRAKNSLVLTQLAAFLAVSIVVIVTPGQDTALTIRNTLLGGRRAGVFTAIGVSAGQACWTVAASAGLAALLQASEPAFLALKLAGAAYLVYLGIQALAAAVRRHPPGVVTTGGDPPGLRPAVAFRDRKSTRLNSSHSQISYAVFCLKKK